jgi:hypothetical protein
MNRLLPVLILALSFSSASAHEPYTMDECRDYSILVGAVARSRDQGMTLEVAKGKMESFMQEMAKEGTDIKDLEDVSIWRIIPLVVFNQLAATPKELAAVALDNCIKILVLGKEI